MNYTADVISALLNNRLYLQSVVKVALETESAHERTDALQFLTEVI
jgi:hypothetical protein